MEVDKILDLTKTISSDIFKNITNPWEAITNIEKFIIPFGNSLDKDKYTKIQDNVWVGENVKVDALATIIPPCIIDSNTVLKPGAYIRGNTIIGKDCVIGSSCEIKNSIIFDKCQIAHFNYVGDSILGYHTHLGAGVVISNLKNDGSNITIKYKDKKIETNLRKLGAIIGDNTNIGCNSVIYPGTIIKKNVSVYPLVGLQGVIEENTIVKDKNTIIERKEAYDR